MAEPTAPEVDDHPDPAVPADEAALPPRRFGIVFGVAAAAIVIDQLTKRWAVSALSPGGSGYRDGSGLHLFWTLHLDLHYNPGVAFSLGSGRGLGPLIGVVAMAVVIGVAFGSTSRYVLGAVAAGLIAGGAIGNLLDRAFRDDQGFMHGSVVDFIDLRWWPVFNVADACVVVGAILLVIASFRAPAGS